MTIDNAANDPAVVTALVICIAVGMAVLLPSLYFLFSIFAFPSPIPDKAGEAEAPTKGSHANNMTSRMLACHIAWVDCGKSWSGYWRESP